MVKGTIREAVAEIIKLGGKDIFKDSKLLSSQSSSNPFKSANLGDYIKFGSYPQTLNGQVQPIEWQVLSKENNKMLVISKYGLDARRFDSSSNVGFRKGIMPTGLDAKRFGPNSNLWKNSEIRQWLNSEFYNKAFTDQEKKCINLSNLSDVGTSDNVFFLSYDEVKKYFANNTARQCKATDYAVKNGAYVYNGDVKKAVGCSCWWLRSRELCFVYLVDFDGDVHHFAVVICDYILARPALWINL